ncbi:MAG: hypothetical protein VXW36_06200 [Candidatus Thermoplasmatota archaeon]|nr:hypothetical protein [Candidatus Thermoplasmatota archaeon]
MKAILVFSSTYVLLFVLHIVFAANDFDHLFRIVAVLLVAMTFFCAPLLWLIDSSMKQSLRIGYVASIPLSIGIAYAYTNMQFQLGATFLAVIATSVTHGAWWLFMKGK